MNSFKVGLDIDGCLADFQQSFIDIGQQLGLGDQIPTTKAEWITWNPCKPEVFGMIWNQIKDDHYFWLDLGCLARALNFYDLGPFDYITARPVPSRVSSAWLKIHNFPVRKVETVGRLDSKLEFIRSMKLDFFLEDRFEAFLEINQQTDCVCLLLQTQYNINRLEEIPNILNHLVVENVQEYFDHIHFSGSALQSLSRHNELHEELL